MSVALNKIIAVEKGIKSSTNRKLTDVHKSLAKGVLLSGISRKYQPKADDGEKLPSEQTKVQVRVTDSIEEAKEVLVRLFDAVATKDWGNQVATGNVVVDGEVLVKGAPVTYLLFLEKQLHDIHTFVAKLPTLDSSETWNWDENQACYVAETIQTHRTKKVPQVITLAQATEHHPAQTELHYEDVVVGFWDTIKYNGALPKQRAKTLLKRVETLQDAVKHAREDANATQIEQVKVGDKVLDWVFR